MVDVANMSRIAPSTVYVCAHRLHTEELDPSAKGVAALVALWQAGIRSFELDFILTTDKKLISGHPDDIASACESNPGITATNLDQHSLQQLRAAGTCADHFPELCDMMRAYAELVHSSPATAPTKQVLSPWQRLSTPLFLIDLKDEALNPATMEEVIRLLVELGIEQNVIFWCGHHYEERSRVIKAFVRARFPQVALGYIIRDRRAAADGAWEPWEPVLDPEEMRSYDFMAPSIKHSKEYMDKVRSFGLPLVTWTIDEAAHMAKSVEVGTHLGISNTPLRYRQVLGQLQQQQEQQQQEQQQQEQQQQQ